ncbi:hypothetical protein Q5X39_17885 [Acinetobacter baumannii]|uniref:hypothetical protein n=1 Tax=Gammaproteobacteria TaxID=1236 RepID=UPI001DB104EB|nr:hypothetical protein [Klebsiella pneumoniae]EHU2607819.1 hypothetical protein [Acinetobacter baumannii]MDO7402780.1 hypothetical protein [Acinetobacter baumannii]
MIVVTIGKNAFPGSVQDQGKYLDNFRSDFKAEFGYPIIYDEDTKLEGIKIGFRFKGANGVPLKMVDKILNKIKSAFNVQ